jgi:monoamine oxidase
MSEAAPSFDPFPWLNRHHEFSLGELYRHPDFLPDGQDAPRTLRSIAKGEKNVLVAGGGIAGLTAAFELAKAGQTVTLVEASDRLGGRIRTEHFPRPGDPDYGEFGAMRIPRIHQTVLHYASRTFRMPLRRFIQTNSNGWYHIRGVRARVGRWEDVCAAFPALRHSFTSSPPSDVLDNLIATPFMSLPDEHRWQVFGDGSLSSPSLRRFSNVTLQQFITMPELFENLSGVIGSGQFAIPGLSQEEWEYLGKTTGAYWDEKTSLLEVMNDGLAFFQSNMYEIVGGMELLVQRFARECQALGATILMNAQLTELSVEKTGVRVTCQLENGPESSTFQYVVMTLPPGHVRRVQFPPNTLTPEKADALDNIQFQSAAKSLVYCNERLWEFDPQSGGIYGGASYTDLPNHQVWYPSDNADIVDGPDVPHLAGSASTPGSDRGAGRSWRTQAFVDSVSHRPGVLIGGYMWGTKAADFLSLSPTDRELMIRESLEEIHPGINNHIQEVRSLVWDEQPNPLRGGWSYFGAGDHTRYQAALCEPLFDSTGKARVFFAGEHIAVAHAWIQSSMQTALGAVWHVLTS